MKENKVSIALCTYNGEAYLQEQLESILAQTRLPDELIICDDGSKDRTVEIIQKFALYAPFSVRLILSNGKSLGSTKNFERAIGLCSGKVIVLSDQDDVWYPKKLAILEKAIDEGADLVFSNAELVDEDLHLLNYTLFESLDITDYEKSLLFKNKALEVLIRRNIVTGAATAFSRKYLPLIMPISENWVHDGWIAFLVASVGNIQVVEEPLFKYRQHSKNQIGARKLTIKEKVAKVRKLSSTHYKELLIGHKDLKSRLLDTYPQVANTYLIELIDKKIVHLTKRAILNNKLSFPLIPLTIELVSGKYNKFSRGPITYFRDLTMMMINLFDRI